MSRLAAAVSAPASAPALYDFLNCLGRAVLYREAGNRLEAELAQLEAGAAAIGAYPVGSEESRALGVILASALRVTEAAL